MDTDMGLLGRPKTAMAIDYVVTSAFQVRRKKTGSVRVVIHEDECHRGRSATELTTVLLQWPFRSVPTLMTKSSQHLETKKVRMVPAGGIEPTA